MTKPAGQEANAAQVRPAQADGDDPFGFSPWLKEMPSVAIPPLMAHPVAAMAAATAIGFGLTSHFAGMVLGAMQGVAERARGILDEVEAEAGAATDAPKAVPVERVETPQGRRDEAVDVVALKTVATEIAGRAGKVATPAGRAPLLKQAAAPVADRTVVRPGAGGAKDKPATVRKGSGSIAAEADDLKMISGVGPKLEQVLNGKGIFRFADIARWAASDVERIEAELGLDGRIARDGWVEQARRLAKAKG